MTLSARRTTRPSFEETETEKIVPAWEPPHAALAAKAKTRESDRAVRALTAAAAEFGKLDSELNVLAAPAGASYPLGEAASRARILAAEARVRVALARVLPSLGEIAGAARDPARVL